MSISSYLIHRISSQWVAGKTHTNTNNSRDSAAARKAYQSTSASLEWQAKTESPQIDIDR
jgi:hypothetical protein